MPSRSYTTLQRDEPQNLDVISSPRPSSPSGFIPLDYLLLLLITLAALLPRLLLAHQMDVVTDETVYILGGKIYFHLLAHATFHDPGWSYNYEHPAFVKLSIGLVIFLNEKCGHLFSELFAARLPSVLAGTLLIALIYGLGKSIAGRGVALAAALCLAFSPWLSYFSALAYLDIPMTLFVSLAFLLLWHAPQRPWLYPLASASIALGIACKYTAVLALPGLLAYSIYSAIQQRRTQQRLPWRWWLLSLILLPYLFFLADPAIWRNPLSLLQRSLAFEWDHSNTGHLTYLAGHPLMHAPFWTIFFILLTKMSLFVTLPAAAFLLLGLVSLLSSYFRPTGSRRYPASNMIFLLCWLGGILLTFSQLDIVVGTHYELPASVPTAFATAYVLAQTLSFVRRRMPVASLFPHMHLTGNGLKGVPLLLLCLILAGSHLWGLLNNYAAEGYTSELFQGENTTIQVAYSGYREGASWIAEHTQGQEQVGLVALVNTLNHGEMGVSWYDYNAFLPARLHFSEAHPAENNYTQYAFLIWPMHLVQRGYALPPPKSMRVIHTISSGQTIYCYILARSTVFISQ